MQTFAEGMRQAMVCCQPADETMHALREVYGPMPTMFAVHAATPCPAPSSCSSGGKCIDGVAASPSASGTSFAPIDETLITDQQPSQKRLFTSKRSRTAMFAARAARLLGRR